MNKGVISDTTKTAKNLARQIAKQAVREPIEILKSVGNQVTEQENTPAVRPTQEGQTISSGPAEISSQQKQKVQARGQRMIQALEAELADIKKTKEQEKMAEVGRYQAEEQKKREETAKNPPLSISSKPSRRIGALGQKQAAQKQTTRVEKPVPPSG